MVSIIVAFSNKDNAAKIRNLIVRSGMDVTGVCTAGAQVLQYADMADEGIVVCGYKLKDMMYTGLREYLPGEFEMLLMASADKWTEGCMDGVIGLSMPVKAYDLINMLETMIHTIEQRRKKRKSDQKNRNSQQKALITKAKELLMSRNGMSEEEAHRYLQKSSMDSGTNMVETAEMILSVMTK
ncbi:MAG: ANTAR domain-containing protein [Dorea sp.]|nr:ANTAR domain-containing protein [Dorea sp.]MCI9226835.1 ANTAR domain-containing protein [Dorea sp.]